MYANDVGDSGDIVVGIGFDVQVSARKASISFFLSSNTEFQLSEWSIWSRLDGVGFVIGFVKA